jgi:hypothetical protein
MGYAGRAIATGEDDEQLTRKAAIGLVFRACAGPNQVELLIGSTSSNGKWQIEQTFISMRVIKCSCFRCDASIKSAQDLCARTD